MNTKKGNHEIELGVYGLESTIELIKAAIENYNYRLAQELLISLQSRSRELMGEVIAESYKDLPRYEK